MMQKIRIKYFYDDMEKLTYIDGKSDWIDLSAAEEVTLPDAVATARLLMAQGTPPAAAAKQAAKGTPFSKGDIYKELIAAKDENDREEESE